MKKLRAARNPFRVATEGPNPLESLLDEAARDLARLPAGSSKADIRAVLEKTSLVKGYNELLRALDEALAASLIDSRTGLANHRGFEEALKRQIMYMHRHRDIQIAVVALDMDGLRDINNTYGHPVGNQALQCLSDALRNNVRQGDVTAHSGEDDGTYNDYYHLLASPHGDEFFVVFSSGLEDNDFPQTAVRRLKGSLQDLSISAAPLTGGGIKEVKVSASIGFSSLKPQDLKSARNSPLTEQRIKAIMASLIQEADRQLYIEKAARPKVKETVPEGCAAEPDPAI